ncbi:glycoside hydrolase family 1 protein [Breznakia sp. OttesenSCG-928-G09]|nr:glycoside hydrolase family 1 protein [Breznakia sp. OttesenSCG-928-G09]
MQKLKFPDGFLWGGASWATGFEGARDIDGKAPDVWDDWYCREPERFYDQIGPTDTLDMYHRYKEYVQLLKKLNINSFRFSISWARFIPDGKGEANPKAVTFYQNLINELKDNDIEPIICLWHFDLPLCMQNIGGWTSREVVNYFISYANQVFFHFGKQIKYFMVLNEVGVLPQGGYLYDFQPPNEIDFKKSIQAGYYLLLAQAKTIELYHKNKYPGEIGTILNPNPVYPRSEDPKDVEAAKFVDMIRERFYLDVSVKGIIPDDFIEFVHKYDLTPDITEDDIKTFKHNTVDLLGVNYYQPCRVQAPDDNWEKETLQFYPENDRQKLSEKRPKKGQLMPEKFYKIYDKPDKKMNFSRGWEIYPKGIYDTLMRLKNEYGNIKCFIGENGMGVENEEQFMDINNQVQDNYRIDFYKEHLTWLHKAIAEGSNCMGYHVWSIFDNWSPINAFKNRYGFYRYDLKDKSMKIKKSGLWFQKLCDSNSL